MGSLSYDTTPLEVKRLANKSLGVGVLESLFTGVYDRSLFMQIEGDELIGFCIYHFEDNVMAGNKVYTGVIDVIVVDVNHRLQGVGSAILTSVLKKMAYSDVDMVEMMVKVPSDRDGEPGVPLFTDRKLRSLGFLKSKTIQNYYKSSSEKWRYDCLFCGNYPDTCSGVLYVALA